MSGQEVLLSNPTQTLAPAKETPNLIPVPRWNEHHTWPPPGGLGHLIFYAATNGFKRAFVRVGRRVLVDEAAFFDCVAEMNGHQAIGGA